jgi:hypothetical protein
MEEHLKACRRSYAKSFQYAPDLARKYARLAEAFQLRSYARRSFSARQQAQARHFIFKALRTDMRIALYEPVATAVTLVAALIPRPSKR